MVHRLNNGRNKSAWGRIMSPSTNVNDIQKQTYISGQQREFNGILLRKNTLTPAMQGEGIISAIKKLVNKVPSTTDILNLIPGSDDTARPSYPGEKHAILKLNNGKYGVANYMGPGTQLEKRLIRGDPPRTLSDKVAMGHDSRYAVAKNQEAVAEADRIMIAKLKDMQKKRQDSNFNIQMGMRPIQAKMLAEKTGIIKPGRIATFGDVVDRKLVEGTISKLEQEGFGLPGDMLKMKLLKTMKRKGKGLSLSLIHI